MRGTFRNITGKQFGFLTALERSSPKGDRPIKWLCKCICGKIKDFSAENLVRGNSKSCGCKRGELIRKPFMSYVEINKISGCWEWTGGKSQSGYGCARNPNTSKSEGAHRVSYMIHIGEIPKGLEIDHLCNNRSCVNPEHLEAVTREVNYDRCRENVRRVAKDMAAAITHCPQGHAYDEKNTYIEWNVKKQKNIRHCRECGKLRARQYRAAKPK